jgi:hypothetical protein
LIIPVFYHARRLFSTKKRGRGAAILQIPQEREPYPGFSGAEDTKQQFSKTDQLRERKRVLGFCGEKGRKCVEQKPAKWGICAKNGAKKARKGMTSLDEKTI